MYAQITIEHSKDGVRWVSAGKASQTAFELDIGGWMEFPCGRQRIPGESNKGRYEYR